VIELYLVTVYDKEHKPVDKFKEKEYMEAIHVLTTSYKNRCEYDIRKVA